MNNKTIIEFGFRIIWRIMEISEGVIRRGRRPRRITPSQPGKRTWERGWKLTRLKSETEKGPGMGKAKKTIKRPHTFQVYLSLHENPPVMGHWRE